MATKVRHQLIGTIHVRNVYSNTAPFAATHTLLVCWYTDPVLNPSHLVTQETGALNEPREPKASLHWRDLMNDLQARGGF